MEIKLYERNNKNGNEVTKKQYSITVDGKKYVSDSEEGDYKSEDGEIIKITILKNCLDDPRGIAQMLSERTHSQVVQVIGRKIILYKPDKKKPKILLPK